MFNIWDIVRVKDWLNPRNDFLWNARYVGDTRRGWEDFMLLKRDDRVRWWWDNGERIFSKLNLDALELVTPAPQQIVQPIADALVIEADDDDHQGQTKCSECWEWVDDSDITNVHNDEPVCQSCLDDKFKQCEDCNEWFMNNDIHRMYWVERGVCDSCRDSYRCCDECNARVHVDDAVYGANDCVYCCDECRYEAEPDDQDGMEDWTWDMIKDWVIQYTSKVLPFELPKQTKIDTPDNIQSQLDDFYDDDYTYDMYHWKDFNESTFINYDTGEARELFNRRKNGYYIQDYNHLKYYNCSVLSSDWVTVRYRYIDIFGNRKERAESIFTIYNYYRKTLWAKFTEPELDKDYFSTCWFDCTFTNNLDEKMKAVRANNEAYNSCQHTGNRNWLARWVHDFLANWCNIPVIIKFKWNIVGRQLVRLMIDKDWIEYMFLDRLYLSGSYSWVRDKIIEDIALRLWSKYNLAIPSYTQHEQLTMKERLESVLWKKYSELKQSLRQPTRRLDHIPRWYYHDSKTVTRKNKEWDVYDKIKQWNYVYTLI